MTTLGPLDYVLNTPAHHRVHHGRLFRRVWVRYTVLAVSPKQKKICFPGSDLQCLDKNYGGVLIVWDRMFGTFQGYCSGMPVAYGLVYRRNSFNPLTLQVNRINGAGRWANVTGNKNGQNPKNNYHTTSDKKFYIFGEEETGVSSAPHKYSPSSFTKTFRDRLVRQIELSSVENVVSTLTV